MRFSLLIIKAETREGDISEEELPPFRELFDAYAASLQEAGALVAADIFRPAAESTTVTLIDAVETLSGCFVIDVPNRAAALDWAEKCPAALYGVVEVRPSASAFHEGRWRGES
jgi:hypothetical protein